MFIECRDEWKLRNLIYIIMFNAYIGQHSLGGSYQKPKSDQLHEKVALLGGDEV